MEDEDMKEIIQDFLEECHDCLTELDQNLVQLEEDPENKDILSAVFRIVHTVKGSSGFLALTKLESIAHAGENVLSLVRDGKLEYHPGITSTLLTMCDAFREIVTNVSESGNEGDGDYTTLVSMFHSWAAEGGDTDPAPPDSAQEAAKPEAAEAEKPVEATTEATAEGGENPNTEGATETHPAKETANTENTEAKADEAEKAAAAPQDKPADGEKKENKAPLPEKTSTDLADTSIRINVGLVNKLMALVGELVLARNQLLQYANTSNDSNFITTCQRMNLVATELQEGVMKTRMQPIANVWNKFPRLVRDLCLQCNKKVKLLMEGKETESDRTLLEAIKDPLTHIVRNSVDHGIETSEVRLANGKPEEGCLILRAYHESGKVNMEIADDGRGINHEAVKNKAITNGLITKEQAKNLTEKEVHNLIFLPGFSTAESITNVSGRGVGMDVVRTNIEKIGGSIEIQSVEGKGTTIVIKIPLTLAIIPALIISSQGERFAIPQVHLVELVRLKGNTDVEIVQGKPIYRLRGKILPLIFLNESLGLNEHEGLELDDYSEPFNVVVLQADDRAFGLVVDEINDTEEIVVKPLDRILKGISCFAGATIMGDGRVALILDVMGLARYTRILIEQQKHDNMIDVNDANKLSAADAKTLLVVELADESRMAIPLLDVSRLEEIPVDNVEDIGDRKVVQYRGDILPLIQLSDVFRLKNGEHGLQKNENGAVHVVVYSKGKLNVGIVVGQVLDIVEENVEVKEHLVRSGVIGSAVIQKRVTDLLNVDEIIKIADPDLYEKLGNN